MKHKNYPYLRLLPHTELLAPSWQKAEAPYSAVNTAEIRLQMDRLRGLSGAVLLLTILLEVCILGFYRILCVAMGGVGLVAFTAMLLAVGLSGAILFYLMNTVEAEVRRNLDACERKENDDV